MLITLHTYIVAFTTRLSWGTGWRTSPGNWQVNRVTQDLVREAFTQMKAKKGDSVFDAASDYTGEQ